MPEVRRAGAFRSWLRPMQITPKRFFDFCATHVPLLHAIAIKPGDVSEAQVRQLIRTFSDAVSGKSR